MHVMLFPGLYCPQTWDGAFCWPYAAAGSLVVKPCPDYVHGFNPNGKNAGCLFGGYIKHSSVATAGGKEEVPSNQNIAESPQVLLRCLIVAGVVEWAMYVWKFSPCRVTQAMKAIPFYPAET
ncbi:hypothetical protein AVEN_201575-1 [Araneus ventricosus]|uniref:G-protein coupled receptors family 2 profile 1 domain-containing protein n=1 Tax=Araneus ventricosus TaxID=182803 RepID=A0A4Y2M5J0_ARAVE|nr:hypothetical protein AVEN_201575-1 [Araneus ventricosus]